MSLIAKIQNLYKKGGELHSPSPDGKASISGLSNQQFFCLEF